MTPTAAEPYGHALLNRIEIELRKTLEQAGIRNAGNRPSGDPNVHQAMDRAIDSALDQVDPAGHPVAPFGIHSLALEEPWLLHRTVTRPEGDLDQVRGVDMLKQAIKDALWERCIEEADGKTPLGFGASMSAAPPAIDTRPVAGAYSNGALKDAVRNSAFHRALAESPETFKPGEFDPEAMADFCADFRERAGFKVQEVAAALPDLILRNAPEVDVQDIAINGTTADLVDANLDAHIRRAVQRVLEADQLEMVMDDEPDDAPGMNP